MAFCPNCGTQVAENVAFCPTCGKGVGQAGAGTPAAAAPPPAYSSAPVTTAAPLEENIAGMLAYFTFIPAIIFLLVEPYNKNRFVRFHSFQCLFLHVAVIVLEIALMIVGAIIHIVPVIGWFVTALLWPLLSLAVFVVWLLVVIKAYQHQIYKLPVIGDMAEKQAGA